MNTLRRLMPLFALSITVALAFSIFIGHGLSQEFDKNGGSMSLNDDIPIYIPLVIRSPNTIFGNVTDAGSAAPNVLLELWHDDGVSASSVISTTTNIHGDYYFHGMAPLGPGESYWVRFENNDNPAHLYLWDTVEMTSFPNGSVVNLGTFDIANIVYVSPSPGTKVVPPSNFQWTPRPATPTDSYHLDIFDFYDLTPFYSSAPLGYVGSYNLTEIPPGFQYCNPYFWGVSVDSPDGGYGIAYYAFLLNMHQSTLSGIHGCVTDNGAPVTGVSVELCRYTSGNFCDSRGTTTTNSGYFSFTGQPSLSSGQEYFVIFENASNSSRLRFYLTQFLDSYTAGSSIFIGDFDIKNIPLSLPADGAIASLPAYFEWDVRPNTLYDDYEFDLYDPNDGNPYFYTDPSLGYEDHYTLAELPPGFSSSTWYAWNVWVYGFWSGVGGSYDARWVSFSPSGRSTQAKEIPVHSLQNDRPLTQRLHNKSIQMQPRWLLHRSVDRP